MAPEKDSFRSLLVRHARYPERVGKVMRDLNPFFRFADAGSYPLERASRLRPARIARVIASAVGKTVSDVRFVSRDTPFPRPDWMTDDAFRIAFTDGLRTSLGMGLRGGLIDSLACTNGSSLLEETEPLRGDLSVLADRIVLGIVRRPDDPLREEIEDIIEECILHLLGLTLFCDPSKDDRLRGLVRLLPKAIPLGERADDPTVWLVLTA